MAGKSKPSLAARAKMNPALLARALKDPGLRSKLPASMLTPELRQQRTLNQPILPGSSMTNRQLQTQTQLMADLKYGPNAVAKQQQTNTDVAGWYDQYRADLQRGADAVKGIGDQSVAQIAALGEGIRGISAADLQRQNNAEQTNAQVTGATPSAQVAQDASNASQVRQAQIAALGAAQAGRSAADSSYMTKLATVVAPGQKLQAQAAGLAKLQDLQDRINTFKANAAGDITAAEAKTIASLQAEAQRTATALQLAGIKADTAVTTTAQRTQASQQAADSKVNEHGYTAAEWAKLSTDERRRIIAADKPKPKPAAPKKKVVKRPTRGPGSLTAIQERKVLDQIGKVVEAIKAPKKDNNGKPVELTDTQIRQMLLTGQNPLGAIPKDIVNIAMDVARRGGLSPANVKAAHRLNIHVNGNFKILKPGQGTLLNGVLTDVGDAVQQAAKKAGGQ